MKDLGFGDGIDPAALDAAGREEFGPLLGPRCPPIIERARPGAPPHEVPKGILRREPEVAGSARNRVEQDAPTARAGGGRFSRRSAPAFEDFDSATPACASGNHSFLFLRRGDSWHGVRELQCPPDRLRKVFIVVLNRVSPFGRLATSLFRRRRST